MKNEQSLLKNLNKIHTTPMGAERIKKNIDLNTNDVVIWCINKIKDSNCKITREGKNWYAKIDDCIITVNAYSYTIITAHKAR
ncbi:MAG: DUF3781 domain-containing protein [Fibrobacteraceae bacterium]